MGYAHGESLQFHGIEELERIKAAIGHYQRGKLMPMISQFLLPFS
jgi:hypothetical protein